MNRSESALMAGHRSLNAPWDQRSMMYGTVDESASMLELLCEAEEL